MELKIRGFKAKGTITVPGSKSETHRALIMAFISKQNIIIKNVTYSDDVNATIDALVEMGAIISKGKNYVKFKGVKKVEAPITINVKESASTLRFLLPLCVYLFGKVTAYGERRLFARPHNTYIDLFKKLGCTIDQTENSITVEGNVDVKTYKIEDPLSSQFVTGILFLLSQKNDESQLVVNKLVSDHYVALTIEVMRKFGYIVDKKSDRYIVLKNERKLSEYDIEGDFSQAAFWMVLGALNGEVCVRNINKQSIQGDKIVSSYIEQFGGIVKWLEDGVVSCSSSLKGNQVIDIDNSVDLAPILFVLAAFNVGEARFVNVDRLRIKESDRILSMKKELTKAGVDFDDSNNQVVIVGKKEYTGDYVFDCYGDHRVMMALSVFAACNIGTTVLKGVECVNKSYPNYVNDLFSLKK